MISASTPLDRPSSDAADRARRDREQARLVLAKSRWKRGLMRLEARPTGPGHVGAGRASTPDDAPCADLPTCLPARVDEG